MKAMVLAAGFGSRLQPLTSVLPKPMFPILGRPLLSHTFDLLISANISDIAINVHHLSNHIIDYYQNEKPPDLNLHFSKEEKILGTAGGIKKMQFFLDDGPFILINSDIITDIDLNLVIEFHKRKKSKLTLVVRENNSPEQYDPIKVSEDDRIVHFIGSSQKNISSQTKPVMFTGIQIMDPEIFERIPPSQFYGTTEDVFPQMIKDNVPVFGYNFKGYWKDMGNRKNYLQANADALDGKVRLQGIPSYKSDQPFIIPPVLIGPNCQIDKDTKIGPHTVIGSNCTINKGAAIERSILWSGITIGKDSKVSNSIVAHNTNIEEGKYINGKSVIP